MLPDWDLKKKIVPDCERIILTGVFVFISWLFQKKFIW